jgi:hypothetical protein
MGHTTIAFTGLGALAVAALLGGCITEDDAEVGDAGASMAPPVGGAGGGAVADCPGAPAGASAQAAAALSATNAVRRAAGAPCATMVSELNVGADGHCAYYAANAGAPECVANPHVEVEGCAAFYAANWDERTRKGGYTGSPDSENMHFVGDGAGAVAGWLDTIYHRYPLLNPWALDLGYGGTSGCDTMDFGVGAGGATPASTLVVYPYDGQTGVPLSFSGAESPAPPAPPAGWPSGYPIVVYLRGEVKAITVTDTTTGAILPTQVVPKLSWQPNAVFFYTDTPFAPATTYEVEVSGNNGADFTKTWSFTTR